MNYGDLVWGLILLFVGIVLLISNYTGFGVWLMISTYWPVVIIILGVWLIIKSRFKRKI